MRQPSMRRLSAPGHDSTRSSAPGRKRQGAFSASAGFGLMLILAAIATIGIRPAVAQIPLDRYEAECAARSDNPWLVTTCFNRGISYDGEPAIVAFRDTPDDSDHHSLATSGQIGSVYGLAYHGRDATIYASAYQKRGVHFGPAGPGGIYAISLRDGGVRTFVTVPDAGSDAHDASGDYFPDTPAREAAGRSSLGDLDLAPDGSELAVMNLNDRRIYRYSVPDGAALGSFPHGASGEGWAGDARPFGLGYVGGELFHGVVNSAQSSGDPDALEAVIYASAPDGSGMRRVASSGLRYNRGDTWRGEGAAIWNPWQDPPPSIHPRFGRYPMPMVTDFAMLEDGSQLVVGMRDRYGDTTFYTTAPTPPPPGELFNNVPAGDVLPAWPDGGGGWNLSVDPEYYTGDFGPPSGGHDETSFGGLTVIPWLGRVVMSSNSPVNINSAGAVWLDSGTGNWVAREQIYSLGPGNLGKANGLGDVEVLCNLLQEPTPTPTTPPSETPEPSPTPTDTAVPTKTPVPSDTPIPSATPPGFTASPTLPATETPQPTNTRRSDESSPPDATPTLELPKLPKTGGADDARRPRVDISLRNIGVVIGLVFLVLFAQRWRLIARRRRETD